MSIATVMVPAVATAPGIGSAGLAGSSVPKRGLLVCVSNAVHSVISFAIRGGVALGMLTVRIVGKSGGEALCDGQDRYRHLSIVYESHVKSMEPADVTKQGADFLRYRSIAQEYQTTTVLVHYTCSVRVLLC